MLRCPPSRINLAPNEVAAFEHRFAARQLGRLTAKLTANVRLSPGPARVTILSLVPEDQNVGKIRAASSSSEATIHDDSVLSTNDPPQATDGEQPTLVNEDHDHHEDPEHRIRPTPRRQIDSYYDTPEAVDDQSSSLLDPPMSKALDDIIPMKLANETTCDLPISETANPRKRYEKHDFGDQTPRGLSKPQLLSSARARRRYYRSKDNLPDLMPTDKQTIRDEILDSCSVSRIPDLVLSSESDAILSNPALDPGAPVFVPLTRFGAATASSIDIGLGGVSAPHWGSVDSSHNAVDLRIRSSSERNSNISTGFRQPTRDISGSSSDGVNLHVEVENVSRRPRRRSRTTDQNSHVATTTANLDRYPMFRPGLTIGGRRRSSRLDLHVGAADSTRMIPQTTLQADQAARLHRDATNICAPSGRGPNDRENIHSRSVSPAILGDNHSTPNLTHHSTSPGMVYSRGRSLSWNRPGSYVVPRNPSTTSVAEGINGDGFCFRNPNSQEGLDAAAEFLRMRSSPLDDLTEKLSRLSTGSAKSATRSWRSTERFVALLAGDPFRAADSRTLSGQAGSDSGPVEAPGYLDIESKEECWRKYDSTLEELVALSIVLPPSSSFPSTPQAISSTPPRKHNTMNYSNDFNALPTPGAQSISTPPSRLKRKPVPNSCKTPKLPVYDDRKPPNTQPQTSTDLDRSAKRSKARSDRSTTGSPMLSRGGKLISLSSIPERHPHRRTYPSGSIPQRDARNAVASAASHPTVASSQHVARPTTRVRRSRVQTGSVQLENDLDGHLQGLESDRQIWMGRQEAGLLDVTPPKEGRYERYLS